MNEKDVDPVIAIAANLRDAPHWPRSGYEAALARDVWPKRIALVAEANGNIAGFLVAALVPPETELESIAVAEEFQRRGVARALFERLVEEIRRRNSTQILLEVRFSNRAGRGFYTALGFREAGSRAGYYVDPVEDALVMRLELTGKLL